MARVPGGCVVASRAESTSEVVPASAPGWAGRWLVPGWAVLLALIVLGPALGPGVVLTYDMVFVPDAGFTPFALGAGVLAPRAVPSDLVVALASTVLATSLVQKLVLVGALVGAGLGCARLTRELLGPVAAGGAVVGTELVAVSVAQWNPFVAERLVLGQWTVLVALAVLPWGLRAALRARTGGSVLAVCGWLSLAALGGASTALIVTPAVLVTLWACGRQPGAGALGPGRWGAVVLAVVAANAAWWLPAVLALADAVPAEPTTAFAARPESSLGLFATLLGGGGVWNPSVVPPERDLLATALLGVLAVLTAAVAGAPLIWRRHRTGAAAVLGVGVLSIGFALLQAVPGTREPVAQLLVEVPGGGLLRDGQKLLAWWVVALAVLAGAATDRLLGMAGLRLVQAAPLLVLAVLLPVAALPSLAWGAAGRVEAVPVPPDYERVRAALRSAPEGAVASVPWGQYRRYAWNGRRVSLDILPRALDRRVLFDDSLPLEDGPVAGEDPVAAQVGAALERGAELPEALRGAGARFMVVDLASAPELADTAPAGSQTLYRGQHLALIDLGALPPRAASPVADLSAPAAGALALTASYLTALLGTALLRSRVLRRSGPTRR